MCFFNIGFDQGLLSSPSYFYFNLLNKYYYIPLDLVSKVERRGACSLGSTLPPYAIVQACALDNSIWSHQRTEF